MRLPTFALAEAIKDEWSSQPEKLQKSLLPLSTHVAQSVHCANSPAVQEYMREQLFIILENDLICSQANPRSQCDEVRQTALRQQELHRPVHEFM